MTVSRIGNHSKGYLGGGSFGNGAANKAVGLGWLAVTGSAAGDVTIEHLSSIIMSDLNQGIFFQSETGANVSFTLCNPGLTADPDPAVQASVVWGNSTALPAGTIVKAPVLFTSCKITFTAPGTVYIGAR